MAEEKIGHFEQRELKQGYRHHVAYATNDYPQGLPLNRVLPSVPARLASSASPLTLSVSTYRVFLKPKLTTSNDGMI
jgi:hypothetical protein